VRGGSWGEIRLGTRGARSLFTTIRLATYLLSWIRLGCIRLMWISLHLSCRLQCSNERNKIQLSILPQYKSVVEILGFQYWVSLDFHIVG
jgi:hypothetical protein